MLDDPLCLVVLAVYVRDLRMGNNLKNRDDLQADTLTGYVRSAHRALSHYHNNRHIDILDPHNSGKSKNFHPIIAQQLADRRKWNQPKPKKLPFTLEMFATLSELLRLQGPSAFFSKEYCVYDWMRLGLFTGFRVSEYGQNKLRRGERFQTIPSNSNVPRAQRGQPVAFIITDFVFYDHQHHQVPYLEVWTPVGNYLAL